MNQNYVIQNLRLNRAIGFIFLYYAFLIYWYGRQPVLWAYAVPGTIATLAFLFLVLHQFMLNLVKRLPESESLAVEKISFFLSLSNLFLTDICYLITGYWFFLPWMMLPVYQAGIFGHARIGRVFFYSQLFLVALSLALQYPKVLSYSAGLLLTCSLFIPLVYIFNRFGNIVTAMIAATSTQVLRLQSLAATDGLTGLINRRQFNHRLLSEISRARRNKTPVSLALFDIDDFKKINDFYGHPIGDRILKELGHLIASNVRDSDIPARYGGEEFALILPDTRIGEAGDILERLRVLIARQVFCLPDNPMTISVSIGIAQLDWENHTSFELVELADTALYEAKRQGKNRVVADTSSAAVHHPTPTLFPIENNEV